MIIMHENRSIVILHCTEVVQAADLEIVEDFRRWYHDA